MCAAVGKCHELPVVVNSIKTHHAPERPDPRHVTRLIRPHPVSPNATAFIYCVCAVCLELVPRVMIDLLDVIKFLMRLCAHVQAAADAAPAGAHPRYGLASPPSPRLSRVLTRVATRIPQARCRALGGFLVKSEECAFGLACQRNNPCGWERPDLAMQRVMPCTCDYRMRDCRTGQTMRRSWPDQTMSIGYLRSALYRQARGQG